MGTPNLSLVPKDGKTKGKLGKVVHLPGWVTAQYNGAEPLWGRVEVGGGYKGKTRVYVRRVSEKRSGGCQASPMSIHCSRHPPSGCFLPQAASEKSYH